MRKHREFLLPDLTPLIDVVFLLLIFFLVSSVLKREDLSFLLNLPKSQYSSEVINPKNINISLGLEEIYLEDKKIVIEELDNVLFSIKDKNIPVNVRIDEEVKYQRIIKIFDLLKKNNLTNLALVSQKE
ncbi:MAG: biopolymer transporter ExbD [Aliarcobacter sp.]|nr:biopolymer transporter ExbD [Aliarcobacter sp.]